MRERKEVSGFKNQAGLPPWIVLALMALYIIVFSAISIRQHDAFLTHKEDLGQIDQAVWNSLHGRLLVETDEARQSTRLTDHVEPVLIAASLVFVLWDDVRALLALQATVAALSAWAIFLLARDVLTDAPHADWLAASFALVYLLFPALEAAHLAEFHAAPLAAAPIAFALLFLGRRQWLRFMLAALAVSAIKEEMALVGVMLGAVGGGVAMLDAARRKTSIGRPVSLALIAMIVSLAWFVLATFVIIPQFGASKYASADSIYFQRYGELGNSPAAVVRTLVTNPALVVKVLSAPERVVYAAGLLASVSFLALFAPWPLLIGAPLLAANLLSNFPAQYSGDFHYSAPLAPFFVVAALYGFARLARWLRRVPLAPILLVAWLLLGALVYHRARGYSPLAEKFYWPAVTPHQQRFEAFAALVPRGARVSTTPPLFPHLSHREVLYLFPTVADADYVLLDASGTTDMNPNDFRAAVETLLADEAFGVRASADGYILLQRGAPRVPLPDAFYDFVRAPDAPPQHRTDISFGDALTLVGYELIPDARWHRVRARLYWRALRPLDSNLRLYPFFHDAQGRIIEDTLQRPMVATAWYPPSRWRVGETIVTETLPWDVGDSFALAVGVMHGNDWERKGRRLTTATGETQVELGTYVWRGKALVRQ